MAKINSISIADVTRLKSVFDDTLKIGTIAFMLTAIAAILEFLVTFGLLVM